MQGTDGRTDQLFSYVSCEARVPGDRPLRPIRMIVDEALEVFAAVFSAMTVPGLRLQIARIVRAAAGASYPMVRVIGQRPAAAYP